MTDGERIARLERELNVLKFIVHKIGRHVAPRMAVAAWITEAEEREAKGELGHER